MDASFIKINLFSQNDETILSCLDNGVGMERNDFFKTFCAYHDDLVINPKDFSDGLRDIFLKYSFCF